MLLYCYIGYYCIGKDSLDDLSIEMWTKIKRSFGLYQDYNINDVNVHDGLSIHAKVFAAGDRYLLPGLQTLAAREYLNLDGLDITQTVLDTWVLDGPLDLQDFLKSVEVIYETAPPGDMRMKKRALLIANYRPDAFNDQEAFEMVVKKYPEFAWTLATRGIRALADKGDTALADEGSTTLAGQRTHLQAREASRSQTREAPRL